LSQTLPTPLRTAGIIAAIGVAIIGIGESLMHWTGSLDATGGSELAYGFLIGIPRDRLVIGHFLSVLAAPAYFLGYWQVSRRLQPDGGPIGKLFFGGSLYVLTMAGIWIGSRAFLARSLQLVEDGPLRQALAEEYGLLLETLIWILRFGMLAISLAFVTIILRGQSNYPKWMAIFNPFILLLLVFSTMLIPAIGPHLVPAALNVAHVPFFLLSALLPLQSAAKPKLEIVS